MTSANADKVEALFEQALKFRPEERAAFLAGACGPDAELRWRIEELLLRFVFFACSPNICRATLTINHQLPINQPSPAHMARLAKMHQTHANIDLARLARWYG